MPQAIFLGTGHYVPDNVVTNDDLAKRIDTSDEWIQQRTGIVERRHVDFEKDPMGASDLAVRAAARAIEDAGINKDEIECIVYATLSPDKNFPGDGVALQHKLGLPVGTPAYDIRNQCSGFLYGLQMSNALIQSGVYKTVLLVGSEVHSTGLQWADAGRDVTSLFGDGAGAVILRAHNADDGRGILSTHLHADGAFADVLMVEFPSSAVMPRISQADMDAGKHYPTMKGKVVFKNAVVRMPEVIHEALAANNLKASDIDLLVPHQANLRINEFVQRKLELPDDKVFNNIMKYGNTTAASIPIALDEARKAGKVKAGDLVCFAAFGAGFTWGAALVRW